MINYTPDIFLVEDKKEGEAIAYFKFGSPKDDPEKEIVRDENGEIISYVSWFSNYSYPEFHSAEVKMRVFVKENRVEVLETEVRKK